MALTRKQWSFIGLGLLIAGGWWYYRKRRGLPLLGSRNPTPRLVTQRYAEAPVIGGYSDGNMKTTLRASDDMPIEERVASIQELVYRSVQDPQMRKLALQITSGCEARDGECEARAIYDYVKQNVRYTGDVAPISHPDGSVEGIDLYQSARRTVQFSGGDCDDMSILIATLLALNGITPRLRVMKESGNDDWSHVYPTGGLPKNSPTRWIALDATLPDGEFGTEVPHAEAIDFPA